MRSGPQKGRTERRLPTATWICRSFRVCPRICSSSPTRCEAPNTVLTGPASTVPFHQAQPLRMHGRHPAGHAEVRWRSAVQGRGVATRTGPGPAGAGGRGHLPGVRVVTARCVGVPWGESRSRRHWRSEHWHFVAGSGVVTSTVQIQIQAGERVDLPILAAHRVAHTSSADLSRCFSSGWI